MQTIVDLCKSCAAEIYGKTAPNAQYADRVARLLAGTAAAESGMRYRRQMGFGWDNQRGAWGLWQTEGPAVQDSLRYLQHRPDVARRAAVWLYGVDGAEMDDWYGQLTLHTMRTLAGWDRAACLFARLHYLRVPSAVPQTALGQAEYWKRYYNTVAGKGTIPGYLDAFARHVGSWE